MTQKAFDEHQAIHGRNKRVVERAEKFVKDVLAAPWGPVAIAAAAPVKPAKYRNVKVVDPDGFSFDSKKEARRHVELKLLEEKGFVREVQRQVALGCYSASPARHPVKVCEYWADFVYFEQDHSSDHWVRIIEDVKSKITRKNPTYRLKAKLVEAYYSLKIREI